MPEELTYHFSLMNLKSDGIPVGEKIQSQEGITLS
jgi:hypothetical protein